MIEIPFSVYSLRVRKVIGSSQCCDGQTTKAFETITIISFPSLDVKNLTSCVLRKSPLKLFDIIPGFSPMVYTGRGLFEV